MSEHSVPLGQELGSGDSDRADPIDAQLQQSANLANDHCDRAVALAQKLSAQLREAQERVNHLEREADGLGDQLLAEAKAIIQEVRSNADARVNRTIREADERIDRLKAEAQNQTDRLQNELAQATRGIDQIKDEAGRRIQRLEIEADARVEAVEREAKKRVDVIRRENEDKVLRLAADLTQAKDRADRAGARVEAVEAEAKKRVDVIRRENEDKVLRLEADLTQAKDRADRAEQWIVLVRREIEDHLLPAMRYGPTPTKSTGRLGLARLSTPSRSSADIWFRRMWIGVTSTAALCCRVRADDEPRTSFDIVPRHEQAFSDGLSVRKMGDAATASEPSAPLPSSGKSAG
jgi:hypothetical protein